MIRFLDFTKMHGAGNDLIVLDGMGEALPDDLGALSRRLADRRFGIGADQVLVLRPSRVADVRMEVYDADGSQVEMCGNGIRAVFKYLRDRDVTDKDELAVETLGGTVYPRWAGADRVAVEMGRPIFAAGKDPDANRSGRWAARRCAARGGRPARADDGRCRWAIRTPCSSSTMSTQRPSRPSVRASNTIRRFRIA